LPSLSTLVPVSEIHSYGQSTLEGHIFTLFLHGKIQTQGMIYTGIMSVLISGFLGAAWVIYKSTNAAYSASSTATYFATYGDPSGINSADILWGNLLGFYELTAILMHHLWAFVLTVWGLWFGFDLWAQVEAREKGYKEEGSGGEVVDIIEAMKMFALCMIVALTILVGSFSLGDLTDKLVLWFDEYADNTKQSEAHYICDSDTSVLDANGTAAKYDIIYHSITLLATYFLYSVIAFGGLEYGFYFLKWNDDFECDFNVADGAAKDEARDLILSIKTYEQCLTVLPQVNKKMDFNGDGRVSRCDSAILLRHLGNTEEYSKKYSFRPAYSTEVECRNFFDPLYY